MSRRQGNRPQPPTVEDIVEEARSSRRKAVSAAPPSKRAKKGVKTELPKEAILGQRTIDVAIKVDGTSYNGALALSIYVKHESTDNVLKRLQIDWTETGGQRVYSRDAAVEHALTLDDHHREYVRLAGCDDQPETIGVSYRGIAARWPFSGVQVLKSTYLPWECIDAGLLPSTFSGAVKQAEEHLNSKYDDEGAALVDEG